MLSSFSSRNFPNSLILIVLSFFCLNVAVLSIIGSYDIRLGWIHLTAYGLFKPLLMMNGCFVIALMICSASVRNYSDKSPGSVEQILHSTKTYFALILASVITLLLVLYYGSATVNFSHHDWNHRHISAGIDSLGSVWGLFTQSQADGFYRPLTFISLWIDYLIFGTDYTGYHIQSIAFHGINALLVAWMARVLGFNRVNSLWAGLLFVAAAVNFEAVLWPAARFDLLATMFTLLALMAAVRYFTLRQTWSWMIPVSLLCYIAAIMNKESGYSFPLILIFFICTHSLWAIPRPPMRKVLLCCILVAAVTAIMIFVRIGVYGSLGGYPTPATENSVHFSVGFRTAASMIRTVPISILGVNTASAAPDWLRAVLAGFSIFLLVTAIRSRGCFRRREYALLACTLLVSVPVVNLVGWVGTSLQHGRYLYMPAVFTMLMLVSALGKLRYCKIVLGIFLGINALGAISNIWIYRDMLAKTESLAEKVRLDWVQQSINHSICLVDLPDSPSGVFFFADELTEKIKSRIPDATILRLGIRDFEESADSAALAYKWNDRDCKLDRVP